MMLQPLTSSTTVNQDKECVDASTNSSERGARCVCTLSSRTAPKGTGQLKTFLKNAIHNAILYNKNNLPL